MSSLKSAVYAATSSDAAYNWPELKQAIHEAHAAAQSTDERVEQLQLHKELMDHVRATQISAEDIPTFDELTAKDVRMLLIAECLSDGGDVDAERLDETTRREVEAGRLAPDDSLRQVSVKGVVEMRAARAQDAAAGKSGTSWWNRIFK